MRKRDKKKEKLKELGNVVFLEDHKKEAIYDEIKGIIAELKDDGGDVALKDKELRIILDEFYNYYKEKKILICFEEAMIDHFNDIADDAYDESATLDFEYVLGELALYELIDSRVEVNPKETKKLIKSIRKLKK